MKKILLGLVGVAALLSSCGSTGNGTSSDGALRINPDTVTFTSNYMVDHLSYQNVNYQWVDYSGPVICDNATTLLNVSFDYSGDLAYATARMRGTSGKYKPVPLSNVNATWSGNHASVDFSASSGTVPLSLKAKTQYVVNPAVIGATYVDMEGVTSTGATTNTVHSNLLPVVSNCI